MRERGEKGRQKVYIYNMQMGEREEGRVERGRERELESNMLGGRSEKC